MAITENYLRQLLISHFTLIFNQYLELVEPSAFNPLSSSFGMLFAENAIMNRVHIPRVPMLCSLVNLLLAIVDYKDLIYDSIHPLFKRCGIRKIKSKSTLRFYDPVKVASMIKSSFNLYNDDARFDRSCEVFISHVNKQTSNESKEHMIRQNDMLSAIFELLNVRYEDIESTQNNDDVSKDKEVDDNVSRNKEIDVNAPKNNEIGVNTSKNKGILESSSSDSSSSVGDFDVLV